MRVISALFALLLLCVVHSPLAETGQYGPIQAGESLWAIAGKTRPDKQVDRHRMMLALWRANPQAFEFSCNLYSLRVGALLRIPSQAEIAAVPRAGAAKEIKRQEKEWAARKREFACPVSSEPAPPDAPARLGGVAQPAQASLPAPPDPLEQLPPAPAPPDAPVQTTGASPPASPSALLLPLSPPVAETPPMPAWREWLLDGPEPLTLLAGGVAVFLALLLIFTGFARRVAQRAAPILPPAMSQPLPATAVFERPAPPRRPDPPPRRRPAPVVIDPADEALGAELDALFSASPQPVAPPVAPRLFDEADFAVLGGEDAPPSERDLD